MAIVVESVTETLVGANDSTPTFNMPGTRPNGDLYVASLAADGSTTTYFNNAAAAGWTHYGASGNGLEGTVGISNLYRVGSSEPASYTWTGATEEYVFYVYRFSGAESGNETYGQSSALTGSSTAAATRSTSADASAGDLVFVLWGIDTDNPTYSSGPTGYTFRGGSSSSAGGAGSVYAGTATRDATTTASESVASATMPGTYDDGWAASALFVNVAVATTFAPPPNFQRLTPHYAYRRRIAS